MKNTKITLPGKAHSFNKKSVVPGFLFKEDASSMSSSQVSSQSSTSPTSHSSSQTTGDPGEEKNITDTLNDSITATQGDIKKSTTKIDELNKVLTTTKDTLKRNYLAAQLKAEKDNLASKNTLLKNQQGGLKSQEDVNKPQTSSQTSALLNINEMENLRKRINKTLQEVGINRALNKQAQAPAELPQEQPVQAPAPVRKDFKVVFDKSTGKPWEVLFTQRGFLVDGTRLSFENAEMAIHKNYNISLNGGQGLVLDQVKLNKILKYKE